MDTLEEEFRTSENVKKWLVDTRNVPESVAAKVAPALFEGEYIYPSTLLNIQRNDLISLHISGPNKNLLFNKLQQQQQQGSQQDIKRQRELQKWGAFQNSAKAPAEVPLPKLMEELPPPPFVAPEGWLDDLCEEVRIQFNRQDTEHFAF